MHPNDGRVVSNFIMQALKGKGITIYGDGSQTRSFCYVDDMIEGLVRFMDSSDSFTGPVNMGNPTEFSILELAKKIIEITGSKSKIKYEKLPLDDPKQRKPDITLVKKELGWVPKVEIEEGLIKTIEYFENFLKNNLNLSSP
jgi:UDP-glucuronate decarboxylase